MPSFLQNPLVWIDCEMSGLNARRNRLLEIAVIVTDGDLKPVDEGVEYIINQDKEHLDTMDEWCTRTHRETGLTQACINSTTDLEAVTASVLTYLQKWIPEKKVGVLAGNSVHVDRQFLVQYMPSVVDWLHYRIVDVSSIKELTKRWYPVEYQAPKITSDTDHRAMSDIKHSIRELQWYRDKVFTTPQSRRSEMFD